MKPLRFSREGTLKGLLLFALLGNLTWEPLTNQLSQMDLASTQNGAARIDCRDAKNKEHAACKVVSADERSKIVERSRQIEAEHGATNNKTTAGKPDATKTEAQATETCEDCTEADANKRLKDLQEENKKLQAKLREATRTSSTSDDEEVDDADTRTSTRPLVEQIKNCEVDVNGRELSEIAELKCQTKLLATLKSRESSSRRKEVTRRIEDLYSSLRKDAKEDLLSKDDDRRSDGERLVNDMLAALKGARFDRDSERNKMIDSLEALRAGAEARVAAIDLEEDVEDLETEMKSSWKDLNKLTRDFQNSCRSRNGCDRDVYDQLQDENSRISELKEEHYELAQTINEEQEDAMDNLKDYRDALTRTELRDFTSPFAKLKSRMETMVDARKLGASNVGNQTAVDALPDDFEAVRNGSSALRRSNGIDVPTISQVPGQLPMGSPQSINTQIGQQHYMPQYMQVPSMMQGQGGSLLPAPGGVMMNGGQAMMGPQIGAPRIMPVGGHQPYGPHGQPGMPQILPAPRY